MELKERKPLDVWLRFYDPPTDESGEEYIAEYEANTFEDDGRFVVEWYHNDVGQVTSVYFDTYKQATTWLEEAGYQDFSS